MASYSSSSPSNLHQTKHDVFISFRGTDTRQGFLSHLTKELQQKQIDVYVDHRLESGEEISSSLVKAIEGSMISLVIFSKYYATSKWCLEELEKIMECKELNGQIVIPVFYNVDPTDVRYQKGTYGDAFAQHEHKFKDNMKKVETWRSALHKAANLSGYHHSNFENESKLIDEIVKDIMEKVDDNYPNEPASHLVGFKRNFTKVESLLEIESQEVKVLGIWGMGGIGKTTLARAVYDKFTSKFESCCFMENVREEARKSNGLSYLLQKLYSKLLDQENLIFYDARNERLIKRRLSRKKVLIVLDDVETFEQLFYLVGEQVYLGQGSRVIITSRDRCVLHTRGVHAVHEIEELNCQESLELFSLYAFNKRHPELEYEELSKSVVSYARGIPLALKVLGSHFLYYKSKESWKCAIKKLEKYPHIDIQKVLKVSFDGLEEVERSIFLDIAFFFKGHPKVDVIRVLDACGFYATSGIDRLLDKALITISDDNKIRMHDLLKEMGEQIVREESLKYPERRSRLKDTDELYDVLQHNMGTDKIEGIALDVSQTKKLYLNADTFKKMPNLRILKMYSEHQDERSNVNVPFGLESFSDKLRYFHWDKYPLESLPHTFCTENLVELRMECSQVKKLWDGVKDMKNLKILNLSGSKQLMELPDFCTECNLERLHLSDCESLCRIHPSILSRQALVSLDLNRCYGLKSLNMTEFCHLTSLKQLSLRGCEQINKMGVHVLCDALQSLESLDFGNCKNLIEVPDNISALSFLKSLNLEESSVESLPASIKQLPKLQTMVLDSCNRLRSLPELPSSIKFLHAKCPSLKTAVPSTNSTLQLPQDTEKTAMLDFSFDGCGSLDEESYRNITEYAHLLMLRAIFNNFSDPEHVVYYPGNSIPEWFTYKETSGFPFMIELAPPSDSDDQLLGFILCGILPHFSNGKTCRIGFYFIFEDHYALSNRYFGSCERGDLVFLWFCPFQKISGVTEEGGNFDHESIPCVYVCEVSDELVPTIGGVCPIYASQYDNIIEKILRKERESGDIDDDQQQVSLELKGSCTIEPVPPALDLAADKSDTSLDDTEDKSNEIQPKIVINLNQIRPPPLRNEIDKQDQRKGLQQLLFL